MIQEHTLPAMSGSESDVGSFIFKPSYHLQKSEFLVHAGQKAGKLYRVNSGFLKIFRTTSEGEESIHDILAEGSLFAEWQHLMDADAQHSYSAQAIAAHTEIGVVEVERLDPSQKERLYLFLLPHLRVEIGKSQARVETMKLKSIRMKILSLLRSLGSTLGKRINDHILLDSPLSHQDLANIISCSRQTMTSNLAALEQERLIRYSRGRILLYPSFIQTINQYHEKSIFP